MGRAAEIRRMPEPRQLPRRIKHPAHPNAAESMNISTRTRNRRVASARCDIAPSTGTRRHSRQPDQAWCSIRGATRRLAEWIVIPSCHCTRVYLEPFFGERGRILSQKSRRAVSRPSPTTWPARSSTCSAVSGNRGSCDGAVARTPYSRGECEQAWDHFARRPGRHRSRLG